MSKYEDILRKALEAFRSTGKATMGDVSTRANALTGWGGLGIVRRLEDRGLIEEISQFTYQLTDAGKQELGLV